MTADEEPGESPRPATASTPAEYTAALRALRTWSGLTYRQLEGKAETYRDALPASTIATTLGRSTLPRERFVDAFTRACGLGEDEVKQWLETRRRIAMADPTAPEPAEDPVPSPRRRRRVPLSLAAVVGVVLGIGGTLAVDGLTGSSEQSPAARSAAPEVPMPITGLEIRNIGSWALIHPARSPSLCVTEGTDRTRRYQYEVAAQLPCTQVQPRVYLEPIDRNVVQIQWHNPEFGAGCLTVLLDGPGRNLVEPRDHCYVSEPTQRFRLERVRDRFRIRPATGDGCLGLRDPSTEVGAELVQEDCSGTEDQEFDIELINPPA
jgi:hypothetical protein